VYVERSDQERAHVGLLKAVFGRGFTPASRQELFPGAWIAEVDAGVSQGTYELDLRDNGQIEGVGRLNAGGPFAELVQASGVGHIWATPIPIHGSWTYDDRTETLTLDITATGFGTKSQDTIRVRATGRERGAIQGTDFAGRSWTLRRAETSAAADQDKPAREERGGSVKTQSSARAGASRRGRKQPDSGPTAWDVNVVREVVAAYCDVSVAKIDVQEPLGHQGLQVDDLDVVEIVMEIESRTAMSLPDSDLDSSADTASVYSLAQALTRARSR
jgi:acyl carrier protein